MIVWFEPDADGTISRAGRSDAMPAGATAAPYGVQPTELLVLYVDGSGDLQQRPASPSIVSLGHDHTVADCPIGTVIEIDDLVSGERMGEITTDQIDQTEVITLPDEGSYLITVTGPAPMLPTEKWITV